MYLCERSEHKFTICYDCWTVILDFADLDTYNNFGLSSRCFQLITHKYVKYQEKEICEEAVNNKQKYEYVMLDVTETCRRLFKECISQEYTIVIYDGVPCIHTYGCLHSEHSECTVLKKVDGTLFNVSEISDIEYEFFDKDSNWDRMGRFRRDYYNHYCTDKKRALIVRTWLAQY